MTDPSCLRCIYCGKLCRPSKEHVLQKSLGGDLTTTSQATARPAVCNDCNSSFSTIDQSLAERSLPAFYRAAFTPATSFAAQLGGEHFHHDSDHDIWLEIKVVNQIRGHLPPQLHLRGSSLMYFGSDAAEQDAFLKFVAKRRAGGKLLDTFIKVGPADKATTPRLVQHRRDDMFVRAAADQDGKRLLAGIDASWDAIEKQFAGAPPLTSTTTIEHPKIEAHVAICFDDNFRAVAKIAFNLLAATKGSDFALRQEFDPIRAYIRGLNIVHEEPADPEEVAVDRRFVREAPLRTEPFVPTDSHAVTLFYDRPTLYSFVTLYKEWSFVIRLGNLELDEPVIVTHEFSIDRTGNELLDLSEVFRRMWNRKHGTTE